MALTEIPLAALRPDYERGWDGPARWVPNGVDVRASLEQSPGRRIAFRLRGAPGAELRATVRLAAAERRVRSHRVAVSLRRPDGSVETLWRGRLTRLGVGRVVPSRLEVRASLDFVGEAELELSARGAIVDWDDARIELPMAAASPPSPGDGNINAIGADDGQGKMLAGAARLDPNPVVEPAPTASPLISVLMPVHETSPAILEAAIASVRAQTMTDWELCIADDGSRDERVRAILAAAAAADERIRLGRRELAGGISAGTNAALELARGEYIALLDHDDELVPDALDQVATLLREHPDTDWVYTDELVVEDGVPIHSFRKPGWSPDLLRSHMYVCHLGVYRREIAERIGGFRSAFDGSQDYDFALRFSEQTDRIAHIPRFLYLWRAHPGSVAGNPYSKPGAYSAAQRALAEHLERTLGGGETLYGPALGLYRVVHEPEPERRVGVVIAAERSAGVDELLLALNDEVAAGITPHRVVLVGPAPVLRAVKGEAERVSREGGSSVEAMLARGAELCADLDVVVLFEEAAVPLTRQWLARLSGFALAPGVGAVGAKVTTVNGLIEQSGYAVFDGVPLPLLAGRVANEFGPLAIGIVPSNVAAVGGVIAMSGAGLRQLGGLDPAGGLMLPDYCLRAGEAGMRTVLAADTMLRRPVGRAAPNDLVALGSFAARWRTAGEPYFDIARGWPGVELAYATL